MSARLQLTIILCIAVILCCTFRSDASTYVPVGDDIYSILSRLEAEGIIKTGILSTKPMSRREAVRLLHEAESADPDEQSPYLRGLIASLRQRLRLGQPVASSSLSGDPSVTSSAAGPPALSNAVTATTLARFTYVNSSLQVLNHNNDGDIYVRGSNARLGHHLQVDDLGTYSLRIDPEYRWSEDHELLRFRRAYAVADLGWDLVLGKDSLWWGPGHHGAILLSNNAEPFTMARIVNDEPITLPWILKYFGPLRFTFFVTNLEHDRTDVPDPYLYGMRFNFKSASWLEIGFHKTAMLGGRNGRRDDLTTWSKSILAIGDRDNRNDMTDPGDQRAGFDVKLTFPFQLQPFQIYVEFDGEDENKNLPIELAYLAGVHFPRILSLESVSFRAEYAETSPDRKPNVWYNHHIYFQGYRYHGRIIGHHMGTNSRDGFMELTYRVPGKDLLISLFYDIEEHQISTPLREQKDETALRLEAGLMQDLRISAAYGYGRIKNPGSVPADALKVSLIETGVEWRF